MKGGLRKLVWLTGHGAAGYLFITMKTHVSIVRCRGYDQETVLKAVRESVGLLGGMRRFVKPNQKVLLKTNLLTSSSPEKGVSPHPTVVKAVLEMVREAGGKPSVGDSPAIESARRVATKAGIASVAEEMGAPLVDFREAVEVRTPEDFTFRRFEVAGEALDADVIINLPKIKTHGKMLLTLGVKNMFGCVPGTKKATWHLKAGMDNTYFARMLVELYGVLKPALTIMDGIVAMEGNGPNSGTPRPLDMVLSGTDCVALDSTVTHLLGLPRSKLLTTHVAMENRVGVGDPENIEVFGPPLEALGVSNFEFPQIGDSAGWVPGFLRGVLKNAILPRPVIDPQRCQECMRCVELCPPKAMGTGSKNIVIDTDKCIRCFCCQEICPEGAIEINRGFVSRVLGGGKGTSGP